MRLIPRSRGGALWRFALGAVIVIAFTATTTAVAGLLQFKQFASDLALTPALKSQQVTVANPGEAQTLLLIGSDHRYGTSGKSSNTDTMMLVRMDPNSSTINLLSVPRDLKVQIGPNTVKLNAAYSIGGPNLLIRILKQQVFPGLHVNHIIDVDFGDFEAMINAIGCVYTDVDRRYYNNTAYTDYSSIDLNPGYQKLCGSDALAFVRYRHGDNDIVRNARQQDFLRWAKSQYGSSELINNRGHLLKIFGANTQTDHNLHTVDGLINLFNLVAFSAGHTIKQIPFPAQFLPCGGGVSTTPGGPVVGVVPCYVGATPGGLARAFHQFMSPTKSSGVGSGGGGSGSHHVGSASSAHLTADDADAKSQAAAIRAGSLPVYAPRLIAPGSQFCTNATCPVGPVANSYPRYYSLHDQSGKPYAAYRITLVINPVLGEYYGVQGTAWQNPPILNSPTETKTVNGKQLMLFFNGHKLTLAAWRTSQGAYWISNTLTDTLSNQQMLGIAASLTRGG